MKKIFIFSTLIILALTLSACGAQSSAAVSSTAGGSSQSNTGQSGASNQVPAAGTQTPGLSPLQLVAGMIKLDGTSNAVTAQQAAKLLPLFQALAQIESTPVSQSTPQATSQVASQGTPQNGPQGGPQGSFGSRLSPETMQKMQAQFVLIRDAMTPEQIQAITAMNLSRQDIFNILQQAGITMGGFGQGGGFGQNGGTFTPPNGTPRAPGTPGSFQGGGGFGQGGGGFGQGGGRFGFGGFLPRTVVDGVIQYLQKKAGA